jgi:hypothetical protein
MNILVKNSLQKHRLPGREISKVVGKDAESLSGKMTMGFARYSEESGPMEPHQHAEEICVVLSADRAWVRYGPYRDGLTNKTVLEAGMTLHVPEMEWHVFEYEPGGFLEIIYFYGQVDNIRPEEMEKTG